MNRVIESAAASNVSCFRDGPCLDEFTQITRDRKLIKQYGWYKKAVTKPTEDSDLPKIEGTEKIRILSTKHERK